MDDDWQLRWVRVPKGTHLSKSSVTPGAERDLLREDGSNRILGPTESIDPQGAIDEGRYEIDDFTPAGPSPTQQYIADVIEEVVRAIPWEEIIEGVVAPAASRAVARIKSRFGSARQKKDLARAESVEGTSMGEVGHAVGGSVELVRPGLTMSVDEFRQRLLAVLAAERYAAHQRELLGSAVIHDEVASPELSRAISAVAAGKVDAIVPGDLVEVLMLIESHTRCSRDELSLPPSEHAGASEPPSE